MHKYYPEMSIARYKKIDLGDSNDLMKNQRKLKQHRASLHPLAESRKSELILKRQLDVPMSLLRTPQSSKEFTSLSSTTSRNSPRIDDLFFKILDSPKEIKTSIKSVNRFRKSISSSLNTLKPPEIISEKEQKDLISDYSKTAKLNMFSITKPGVRYRKSHLEKRIQNSKS